MTHFLDWMIRQYCPSELSSEQKANFLIGHLDGVAWEKVEELDEGARKSFDAVVTHLRHFFESPQQRYVARQKLSVCKQEPGEAAATFANRVLNLVRSATAGQDPATQKDKVLEEFQAVTKAQMVEQLLSEATAERLISPGKPEVAVNALDRGNVGRNQNAAASRQPLRRDGPIYPERCYNCGGRGYRVIHRPSPPEPYRSKEDRWRMYTPGRIGRHLDTRQRGGMPLCLGIEEEGYLDGQCLAERI
uniref:Retrotrans_gag domain-containing protein n=1 Tax=Haemonchus contortus TaxID=6289 RepID=A0A7I5EAU8_HAECO